MQFEADLIKALQTLSNGFTDVLGQIVSFFGTETFFLIVAVIVYWCIDKAFGYRFFNAYILGVAMNNVMKISFKRTRPFTAYPDKVTSIGDPEPSYSFPSGHTNSIASLSTLLTVKYGKKYKAIPIIGVILTVAVMLSRMFLGQHYLSDVFTGLTSGIAFAILFNFLLSLFKDKEELFVIPAIVLSAVLLGVLGGMGKLDSSPDLLKGIGAFLAFDIGYFIEKKFVRYDIKVHRTWWTVVMRLIFGLGVTLGIQQGFKTFLPESIPMLYCFLRYFLMALWAAFLAPLLFKVCKI